MCIGPSRRWRRMTAASAMKALGSRWSRARPASRILAGSGGERLITTRHVIIATGARPRIPSLPGIERLDVLTSDNLWSLESLPARLVILGGGPIGCELGQSFARLGSRVILIESGERLLPKEDDEVSDALVARLVEEGVEVRLGTLARQVMAEGDGHAWRSRAVGASRR